MEVRVGVGMGERVQPGVVEAFFCRGSLPVHTNTITLQMSGNSSMVYISSGRPGSSDSPRSVLRHWLYRLFIGNHQKLPLAVWNFPISPLGEPSAYLIKTHYPVESNDTDSIAMYKVAVRARLHEKQPQEKKKKRKKLSSSLFLMKWASLTNFSRKEVSSRSTDVKRLNHTRSPRPKRTCFREPDSHPCCANHIKAMLKSEVSR